MQTLYSLRLNGRPITNWTDLQLACHCLEVSIQVLAEANVTGELQLDKTALLNSTMRGVVGTPVIPHNDKPEVLALFKLGFGNWDSVVCKLHYDNHTFKESE